MTTVQSMLGGAGVLVRAFAVLALLAIAPACAHKPPELVAPEVLVSPYGTTSGDLVWAVAPLANESGTSAVDPLAVSDALVAKITEVEGLAGVPMNRTLYMMRALGLSGIRSGADARRLAESLGADGILVGTITAYDPYNPPTIGLAVALFARDGTLGAGGATLDPRALQKAYTDHTPDSLRQVIGNDQPLAVVSEQLEGRNQGVQMNLRRYAEGRHEPDSAMGWKRYLASMDLYTEFASYWTVRHLLDLERMRLARPAERTADSRR